jgi:IS5 family transposase
LKRISQWLDQPRSLLRLVSNDLRRDGVARDRPARLPAEAVLRCALLKQYR